ncbi:aminotransferase [Variovorax sp.]|jgi:4-aminobutyrate---pyruvate transaminase|uniref:aminotransferase n=1 Tax=Variovorax sp. TaxID=1871043 RepID=UPI0012016B76|nr:aminotransferase [Variovorax sp.]TAJ60257.1 MAG: aminotransferase class III-fold pyridoxal phosphate-dependent enzyme [Variovorax sp.]
MTDIETLSPDTARHSVVGKADTAHHLHSQTNLQTHRSRGPLVMVRGEGAYVFDEHGQRYLEGMAGLWCASLGFSESRLVDAALRQMRRLPYYHTFNHRSTDVASLLAAKVAALAPMRDARVFFATSGSEANDSMVKLAWNFHIARGEPARRKILARQRGFHGSTVMGASLSGLPNMHAAFGLPIPGIVRLECPSAYRHALPGESDAAFVDRLVADLEHTIEREGAGTIAAFIAEPIIGAGGVLVPPEGYFPRVQAVLRRHGILMLSDEIICGFGRTGEWFGAQSFGFEPDMMACAKGLSAGYAPISCVVVAPRVYEVIEAESGRTGGFGHGFTYSGHPLGAAVALEALSIYEQMDLPAHARRLGERLHASLAPLAAHPLVGEIRGRGFIAGIELVRNRDTREAFDPTQGVGAQVEQATRERGLIVRNMGDVIALSPPYVLDEAQVEWMARTLGAALDEVAARDPWKAPAAARKEAA